MNKVTAAWRTSLAASFAFLISCGVALADTSSVPEWEVKALFPRAQKIDGRWIVNAGDLMPRSRDLPWIAGKETGLLFAKSANWTLAKAKVVVSAVATSLHVDCEGGSSSFMIGVFSGHDLIARSRELFPYGSSADAATGKILDIDTARYQISETERAFGVRNMHSVAHRYQCFADQTLDLFRIVGDDVVRILSTDVAYEQTILQPDNESGEEKPECSVDPKSGTFRMLPTKTKDFFDIERNQKGVGRVVYRWDGSKYALEGKDPVDHSVREAWDWCTGPLERQDRADPMSIKVLPPPPGK